MEVFYFQNELVISSHGLDTCLISKLFICGPKISSMPNISLVVLDMAGTTLRDVREVETCFAKACAQTGLQVSADRILALQGYAKVEVFRLLWTERMGDHHPDLEDTIAFSYLTFRSILEENYRHSSVIPTEGCVETLTFLKESGIPAVLTTGFYRDVVDIIWNKMSAWVPEGSIQAIVASDEVAQGRPAPDLIFRAMAIVGVDDPKEVVHIGDTPADLKAGYRAGCGYNLAVINGTHTTEQLSPYPHDHLLGHLGEFIEFIHPVLHAQTSAWHESSNL